MDTSNTLVTTGTREELVAELERLMEGWDHLGKPKNASACREGVEGLTRGASTVWVGTTEYRVTEDASEGTVG